MRVKVHPHNLSIQDGNRPRMEKIDLQTQRTNLLPCRWYCSDTKGKAKDITGTNKLVYGIKMVNGFKKKYSEKIFMVSEVEMVHNDLYPPGKSNGFTTRWANFSRKECDHNILGRFGFFQTSESCSLKFGTSTSNPRDECTDKLTHYTHVYTHTYTHKHNAEGWQATRVQGEDEVRAGSGARHELHSR